MLSQFHKQPFRVNTTNGSVVDPSGFITVSTQHQQQHSTSSDTSTPSPSSSSSVFHSPSHNMESHAELEHLAATMPPVGGAGHISDHLASSRSHSRMSISHTKG